MSDTLITDTSDGWGVSLQPAGCAKCGVVHLVPPAKINATCPNCFSAKLSPQPARLPATLPERYLPFSLTQSQITNTLEQWAAGIWFRPDEFNTQTLLARLTKTYFPMWLVDGTVTGVWEAQAGYDYQVASSQERYHGGQWTTHKITETRIRWEPRTGEVTRSYQNVTAPAVEEHQRLLTQLGQYPLNKAAPYSAEAVQGTAVRAPNLLPEAAWPIARTSFERQVAADCQIAAVAQHLDQFKLQAEYQNRNWTQLLLPMYTTAYRDEEGHVIPVLINGHTGRVAGKRRASPKKGWLWTGLIAALALICFIVAALITLAGSLFPPLVFIGGFFLIVSLGIALAAPIPALSVWRTNQRS